MIMNQKKDLDKRNLEPFVSHSKTDWGAHSSWLRSISANGDYAADGIGCVALLVVSVLYI